MNNYKYMMNFKPVIKGVKSSMLNLPCPSNLSTMWSFGSMLTICLFIQIFTGLFLSMHYCANTEMAFNSISHIVRDVNGGWILRSIHANGASLFFLLMYTHIARGMYFNSMKLSITWFIGIIIFLVSMGTAFMGYVLPWGQMSFWGAAVITNLLSAIPYMGTSIVYWLWGGFSVNNATLNRFYSFHFILPFILLLMVVFHFLALHTSGSSNPLGSTDIDKIPFHPSFTIKDMLGFSFMLILLMSVSVVSPYILNDPENFIPANPMVTPIHIQPEWYFLFAYAILRSIPNKLGGVIALLFSILVLFIQPITNKNKIQSNKFYPINKFLLWMFFSNMLLLTWIGARPVEPPYEMIGVILTFNHFLYFIINPIMLMFWDKK
uniref:Cytochrome b n=1 Tax=Nymphon unguiculatum-charcoti complex sp. SEM-1997 TaxID=61899 RepID=E0XLH7_9CHEL|nr:cytochrome b [Nymphon unguiculatum-charcoti complex sp. SEM-1997]